MPRQLDLFAAPPVALDFTEEATLASALPPGVRFGCSSWTFPGWSTILYPSGTTEAELRRDGLRLYCQNPLLSTVGIDRSFYRPLEPSVLRAYSSQLPPAFRCVVKVFSEITQLVDPRSYEPNPSFMDVRRLEDVVVAPLREAFSAHLGPLVLEFSPMRHPHRLEPGEFVRRLDRFLGELPKDISFAVELRNREYFSQAYVDILARHDVAHVLSYWEDMPPLAEQLALPGVLEAGRDVVVRLLIPPGRRYASQRSRFEPFDRIVQPQPAMRDDVLTLIERVDALGKVAFVIVNNKAEGCSPLTILEMAKMWRERRGGSPRERERAEA